MFTNIESLHNFHNFISAQQVQSLDHLRSMNIKRKISISFINVTLITLHMVHTILIFIFLQTEWFIVSVPFFPFCLVDMTVSPPSDFTTFVFKKIFYFLALIGHFKLIFVVHFVFQNCQLTVLVKQLLFYVYISFHVCSRRFFKNIIKFLPILYSHVNWLLYDIAIHRCHHHIRKSSRQNRELLMDHEDGACRQQYFTPLHHP